MVGNSRKWLYIALLATTLSSRKPCGCFSFFQNYDNDNAFINDLWPIQPNRQVGLYTDIHEGKIQGYIYILYI